MNILMALLNMGSRYGKYGIKWLGQSGFRVAGRTLKRGAKYRGVLSKQPGRRKKTVSVPGYTFQVRADKHVQDIVVSPSGRRTIISPADVALAKKHAHRMSKFRKGAVTTGGVGGGVVLAPTRTADDQKTDTPPELRQKVAPSLESVTPPGFTSKGGKWVKAKKTVEARKVQKKEKGSSFGEVFNLHRYGKGGFEGKQFSYGGKEFVAVSKDDLKKRGLKDLGQWYKRKASLKKLRNRY